MEKRNKPLKTTGIKRRRKGSASTAASVPKTMKFDISDNVPSTTIINSDQPPTVLPKFSTVESITPETKPLTIKTPKKKKAKKNKGTPKTEDNSIPSPIESGEKNGKPMKKKKHKELLAELNALKDIIVGPTQNMNKDLNSEESLQKNKKAKAVNPDTNLEEADKWPVLKDKELIEKFLKVSLSNNQKGKYLWLYIYSQAMLTNLLTVAVNCKKLNKNLFSDNSLNVYCLPEAIVCIDDNIFHTWYHEQIYR